MEEERKISIKKVKTISDYLHKYEPMSDRSSFISVTEWANGEGWDISINERSLSLTYGELRAINFLTDCLDFADESIVGGNNKG